MQGYLRRDKLRLTMWTFSALILALAMAGVAYAHWSETLYISGTVNTGELDVAITAGDSWDTEPYEKDVSSIRCWVEISDPYTLWVEVKNAYPCIDYHQRFTVRNTGTIPVHLYLTLGQHDPDITVEITGIPQAHQLHPNEAITGQIHVHVEQGAEQGSSYNFTAEILAVQWNDPPAGTGGEGGNPGAGEGHGNPGTGGGENDPGTWENDGGSNPGENDNSNLGGWENLGTEENSAPGTGENEGGSGTGGDDYNPGTGENEGGSGSDTGENNLGIGENDGGSNPGENNDPGTGDNNENDSGLGPGENGDNPGTGENENDFDAGGEDDDSGTSENEGDLGTGGDDDEFGTGEDEGGQSGPGGYEGGSGDGGSSGGTGTGGSGSGKGGSVGGSGASGNGPSSGQNGNGSGNVHEGSDHDEPLFLLGVPLTLLFLLGLLAYLKIY